MEADLNTLNIGYDVLDIAPMECCSCGGHTVVTFTDIEYNDNPGIARALSMKIYCYDCQEDKDFVYALVMAGMN